MAKKSFEFSILAKFRDLASAGLKSLTRTLKGTARAATGGLFGTRGIMGTFMPGSLLAGGLFGGIVSAAKFAVKGVISVFTGMVKAVVTIVRTMVSAVVGTLQSIAKLTAVAVAGATAALAMMIRSVAQAGDEIAKMAKRTGLAVEFLSEMQHVLALNDATLGDLQTAMRGLGRAIEGGVRGAGEYLEVWQALGVNFRDTNGQLRDAEQLFMDVVDALGRVENATLRMGLAQRIFGRSGERMLALIDAGTGSLREQREAARALGATWSGELARAAERLLDAWTSVGTAWRALKREFVGPLMAPLAAQFEALAQKLAGFRERATEWGAALATAFGHVRDTLAGIWDYLTTRDWEAVWSGFKDTVAGLPAFVEQNFAAIRTVVENTLGILENKAMDVVDRVVVYLGEHFGAAVRKWGETLQGMGAEQRAAGAERKFFADVPAWQRWLAKRQPGARWAVSKLERSMTPAGRAHFEVGGALEAAGRAAVQAAAGAAGIAENAPARQAERDAETQRLLADMLGVLQRLEAGAAKVVAPVVGPLAAPVPAPAPAPVPVQTPEQELAYAREAREEVRAKIAELERTARLQPDLDMSESFDWLVKMLRLWNDQEVRVLGQMEDGVKRVAATANNNTRILQQLQLRFARLGAART